LKPKKPINPYLLLLIGILAVSTAAILIRLILLEASALVIAAYRLALSALISGLLLLISHKSERAQLNRKDIGLLSFRACFYQRILPLGSPLWNLSA